ncbi:MAG: acyl-protein synthetase, partial [Myxococcota bacterium]|nr:acyl-protein synthetase [Myxococcota bacterium]
FSLLPWSYPGHILLTEDEGEILGEDDCPCGRLGKYFKIHGRIAEAEIRGCSDTHEG